MLELLSANALLVLGMMAILWVISVWRRDASIVDPWWSMGILLVTAHNLLRSGWSPAKVLTVAAVLVWAVRLWLHLLWRARGQGEDPRYAAFRANFGSHRYWWVSFFQVFMLQGLLVLCVSAPVQLITAARAPDPITWLDGLGLLIFLAGFGCEVIADEQLRRYRAGPRAPGSVLDSGLWRYSRHPNYFGEALLWWGFGIQALDEPFGWLALLGPALMTFLLVRVSGVAMLDKHMLASNPEYRAYMRRTSSFLPMRPKPKRASGPVL